MRAKSYDEHSTADTTSASGPDVFANTMDQPTPQMNRNSATQTPYVNESLISGRSQREEDSPTVDELATEALSGESRVSIGHFGMLLVRISWASF